MLEQDKNQYHLINLDFVVQNRIVFRRLFGIAIIQYNSWLRAREGCFRVRKAEAFQQMSK